MTDAFVSELIARTLSRVAARDARRIALVGFTAAALQVRSAMIAAGLAEHVVGIFDASVPGATETRPLSALAEADHDLVVICFDADKQQALLDYRSHAPARTPPPEVVLAGSAHLEFRDDEFETLNAPALVPSYATGSPYTRAHLFQCLKAAAGAGLRGAIVEFGAFKGGTTAWLARTAAHFGLLGCRVIGFDSWAGFPPRRSVLDLYEHPRCVFTDLEAVRAYVEPFGVELVPGDIAETYTALEAEPLLLCCFDTDNYSPARAALDLCARQLVVGGSIVFDHVATTTDYIETIGERIAAFEVLDTAGFLHLHGTGVFTKIAHQRA
jgi:O-methyltransferase